jgi:hypothetical protein
MGLTQHEDIVGLEIGDEIANIVNGFGQGV